MYEVLRRLRDKRHASQARWESAAEVDVHAARGREFAGLCQKLEARVPRDRVDLGVAAVVGDVLHAAAQRPRQLGVALQVARVDDLLAKVVRVVEREVVPPFVPGVSELCASREGFELARVGTEANRMTSQRDS